MVFEKAVDLITALMVCFIVILPVEGFVMLQAGDTLAMETPILYGDNSYAPQNLSFEKGQGFAFEISRPNLVGSVSYEVKKLSKYRILVTGVFTYYVISNGKDGPTTLWDVPITIKKSFWINSHTFMAQNQDYLALLWNAYMGDSLTNYKPGMVHAFEEDLGSNMYTAHGYGSDFDPLILGRSPEIKKFNFGYVTETKENISVEREPETMMQL